MYGGKNVRNNQPDLQAHWFIANYVVAAVYESERADRAMEALRYAGFHVVVATAVGGIPEQVRHGREGLLVPPGDHRALGEAYYDIPWRPSACPAFRAGRT